MANAGWAQTRRVILREVAEALGGDDLAYRIAGVLLRRADVTTVADLRGLEAPERVPGIGVVGAYRIQQALEADPGPDADLRG